MAHPQPLAIPPDARLTLTTLGRASLSWTPADGSPTVLLGPGKPLALITYLAFSPRRTASRDYLVGLLWADSEPDRALHAMRQAVWQIRHALGEQMLVTRGGGLALEGNVETDRDTFLAAVEAGDVESAVALYSGDFLPAFAAPGGAEFEQWADLERVRLRTAFLRSAESFTRRQLASGRVREAQRMARRARDADPLNEGGWRLLFETLEAGNDWTAAAMEADALERLLQVEEREPEPATRAAIRRARKTPDDVLATPRSVLVAELVGREREFATILGAWEEVRHGGSRHIHLTAAAGLGKTRLLQDVHARLRAAGARTVHARAHPGERGIGYAFAADIASALASLPGAAGISPGAAAALVALNPSLSARYAAAPPPPRGEDALRHRTVALAELLGAVTEEGPVALLLDDLHWADPDSRQIVAGLAARLGGHRGLLVTAARPVAERIFEESPATLRLTPLDEPQVAALVTSIASLPAEPWARDLPARLAWATGGSPLLLLESLQLALERETLAIKDSAWTSPDPAALSGILGAGSALRRRLEELDSAARWLILSLAVAGTPLTTTRVALAAGRPEEAVLPALTTLEERGLLSRAGSTWEPVHDELASLALDAAAADTLRDVRRAVGRALAGDASRSPGTSRQAASLLALAGDEPALANLFQQSIRAARSRGDHRSTTALGADLLGEHGSAATLRALRRALPLHMRLGLDRPGRRLAAGSAAALTLLAAAGAWLARGREPAPDEVLYVVEEGADGRTDMRQVEIRAAGWQAGDPLPRGSRLGTLPWPVRLTGSGLTPSHSGDQWLGVVTGTDSGGQEIYLADRKGDLHRLTTTPGDDGAPSWSPDDAAFVFETGQWRSDGHYDLAIHDLRTGRVASLTSGDAADQAPRWSPGGERIAFVRRYYDGREREACLTTPGGSSPACRVLPGVTAGGILGWRDDERVVIQTDSAGSVALRIIDVESGAVSAVSLPEVQAVQLSPDGEWLLFQGILPGTPKVARYVAPLDNPSALRPLVIPPERRVKVYWGAIPRRSPYLDRVAIRPPGAELPVNGFHHLEVEGRDQHGQIFSVGALRWHSGDTTIAVIGSTGLLQPRRRGTVAVHVSAGGWRSDSVRVTIGDPTHQLLLRESWNTGLEPNWIPFGEPLPEVSTAPDGRSMLWNRGDGSHQSGVYTRRLWSAQRALGVEVTAQIPLTTVQWQTLTVWLDPALDSVALAAWDHRTRDLYGIRGEQMGGCYAGFPDIEGPPAEARILVSLGGLEPRRLEPPPDMKSGAPHRFRVQILADGRCGVALDGRALWVSHGSASLERPYRVALEGKSHETRILVGQVELWQGVRGDVDWRVGER